MKRMVIWTEDNMDDWRFELKGTFQPAEIMEMIFLFIQNMANIIDEITGEVVVDEIEVEKDCKGNVIKIGLTNEEIGFTAQILED